ncbi:MAG TPA: DUF6544 family protein [Acidimicrobiales bacterium]|nr:DUF6544 family protein [Acidimicrobiales bacterium]
MTALAVPSALRDDWDRLLRPTPDPRPFDPDALGPLPDPARRWLTHAITPGTPLRRRVRLDQRGEIRLRGRWWPMRATQALDPLAGLVWPVEVRMLGLPVRGFDRVVVGADGPEGEMTHRLLGRLTVMHLDGPDYLRSASARPASEIMWSPAAALDERIRWRPVDDESFVLVVPVGGHDHEVTLTVGDAGAVRSVSVPRWAQDDDGTWRVRPFGGRVDAEATFDGFTIPTRTVAGYGDDPAGEGAFVRQTIETATFA